MLPVSSKWVLCWVSVCSFELFAILAANCDSHDVIHASPKVSIIQEQSTGSIEGALNPDVFERREDKNDESEQKVNSETIELIKGSGLKNDKLKGRRWFLMQPETITKAGEDERTQDLVVRAPQPSDLLRLGRVGGDGAYEEDIPFGRTYQHGDANVPPELQRLIEEARKSNGPIVRQGVVDNNGQPVIYKYESSREQRTPPKTYQWSSEEQVPPKTYEWQSSQQQVPPKALEWQSSQQQVPPQSYQYEYSQKTPVPSQMMKDETGQPLAWVGKTTSTTSKSPQKEEEAISSESSDDDTEEDPDYAAEEALSSGGSSSGSKSSKSGKSTGSSSKNSWTTKSGVISGSTAAPVNRLMAIKRVRITKYHKASKAASKALSRNSARSKKRASKSRAASFSRSNSASASRRGLRSVSRSGGFSTGKRSPRKSPRSSSGRRRKK